MPVARLAAAIVLLTGAALAADPSCKPLLDTNAQYLKIPTHVYSTVTADYTGGKPRNSQTIYLIDKTYVQIDGKWRVSPVTPKKMLEMLKDAKADPDSHTDSTCRVVRDEVINGESATLYSEHRETQDEKSDSQIWISKSRGLPLKLEATTDRGGPNGKRHTLLRFEYTNVQAPAGVQ
ncbi:MAG TPA: hypothetical protein VHW09_28935 [Bryobacteraceae bacterium]|jgi:hypothetical protein|nr:hypothetical protein [Bryobacteraceae bacterium]